MIQDMHSHTYYSFCGKDSPSTLIETAIDAKIELLGITDHSYGIVMARPNEKGYFPQIKDFQRAIDAYIEHISLLKEKYADKIEIKCGIEIPTQGMPHHAIPDEIDLTRFDYCLIEHIDFPSTICESLFDLADRIGCKTVGIAHTDLPSFLDRKGIDKLEYFTKMAQKNIFWEMNVNYDSTHKYREHEYVKRFFEDAELQQTVRESGVCLSVGFDSHRVEDYLPERVKQACERISALGLPMIYNNDLE